MPASDPNTAQARTVRRRIGGFPAATFLTLLAFAALAAGCGGSSKSGTATTEARASAGGPPTASTPRTTTTRAGRASTGRSKRRRSRTSSRAIVSSRVTAVRALLRLSDLPAGFVARPRTEPRSPSLVLRPIGSCLHMPASVLRETNRREVKSPTFRGPGGVTIRSSAAVLPTEAEARRDIAILEEPQAPSCLSRRLRRVFARGLGKPAPAGSVRVGTATVTRIPFARQGAQTLALRIQIPVTTQGLSVTEWFDAVVLRSGDATATLSFGGEGRPVSSSLERSLTALAAGRLQAAVTGRG